MEEFYYNYFPLVICSLHKDGMGVRVCVCVSYIYIYEIQVNLLT
jgi:hypothetical protein